MLIKTKVLEFFTDFQTGRTICINVEITEKKSRDRNRGGGGGGRRSSGGGYGWWRKRSKRSF